MLLKVGSKGSLVLTLQRLLLSLNFEIDCDGIFGSGTEKIVKLAQEDLLVSPCDGIVGNKTWKALIEASKHVTKNYKESIVWLNPKDLKCALVNETSASLTKRIKNFVNGTFFWWKNGVGNCVIGWLYSEGKRLNYSNINRKRSTLVVKKDGSVICKLLNDSELMKIAEQISFCIQGYKDAKSEGFNPIEVSRKCIRPIIGYSSKTNKILIAMFNGDTTVSEQIAKKYGLDYYLNIDAGGSSNMYLDGFGIFKTNRILNNIIYW